MAVQVALAGRPASISSGSVPAAAASSSPRFSRSSGSMYSQPEQRVHLRLGRAAVGLAGGVVEHPVLGDVQALAHGRVAQRHVVLLGAGEVLEQVAELVGRDDPQVDLDARCGCAAARPPRPGVPASSISSSCGRRAASATGSVAVAITSRSLTLSVIRRAEPASSTCVGRGVLAERGDQRLADRERAVEHDPGGPLAGAGCIGGWRGCASSALGPNPFSVRICCSSAACAQRFERVDPELLVQPPGALGPEPRQRASSRSGPAGTWRAA